MAETAFQPLMETSAFLTLPNELINQITSELSDKQLAYLRVANKRICSGSLDIWKKRALQDKDGRPALNWAAEFNHPSLICYLFTEFPNMVIDVSQESTRENLLRIACERGNNEAALALINHGADVNYASGTNSALIRAIYACNATLVQMLLDNNADSHVRGYGDSNILQAAARRDCVPILQVILDRMRAYPDSMPGINDQNRSGFTALHFAADIGAIAAATLLLDFGADIERTDERFQTPLGIAVPAFGPTSVSMARLLLSHGANIEGHPTENPNVKFDTPLHVALQGDFDNSLEMTSLLITHGASLNSIAASGDTTMMSAIRGEHSTEKMRLIIDQGGDVNMLDCEGSSAVHLLADYEVFDSTHDILLFLQENGADIFLANQDGLTPRDIARDCGWDRELIEATWGSGFVCKHCRSCTVKHKIGLIGMWGLFVFILINTFIWVSSS